MPRAPNVAALVRSVGGVYRDQTTRISNDATKLLKSSAGRNLQPSTAPLVQNDGSSTPPLLLFSGTISILFRGASYNIPVDIFVPPRYPASPPVCFVRPISSMMIKANHEHVAGDGMVYMPYLHSWKARTHNLVILVETMAILFGRDPPVFAKPPPTSSSSTSSSVVRVTKAQQQQQQAEAAVIAESRRLEEERHRREEEHRIFAEAERANAAAEEVQRSAETRRLLTIKLQHHLREYFESSRLTVQGHLSDQAKLTSSTVVLDQRFETLRETKTKLEQAIASVDGATKQILAFLTHLEEQQKAKKKQEQESSSTAAGPDEVVMPGDVLSAQMLELSAENAALGDAMYFLDRALVKGRLPLDVHLKKIRTLAKRQFLVRAHLLKINKAKDSMRFKNGRRGVFVIQ